MIKLNSLLGHVEHINDLLNKFVTSVIYGQRRFSTLLSLYFLLPYFSYSLLLSVTILCSGRTVPNCQVIKYDIDIFLHERLLSGSDA